MTMALPQGAAAADPMLPRPFRIVRSWRELSDTFSLELLPADDGPLPAFTPGQFNMLYVFGVGEVPISISGDPFKPDQLIHTVRAVGPVTEAMRGLKKGALVGVRGPFGRGWPVAAAEGSDLVIVAGGVGLAPLRPALYHALARRAKFGRVVLLYGARTPRDILYHAEVKRWRGHFDLDVAVTVDRADRSWGGAVGVVTNLIRRAGFDPLHTTALVCGPEVMMRFAVKSLVERGVAKNGVFVSMERNMKCALGFCGHCQLGGSFVCKDGPVFAFDEIETRFNLREL